MSYPISIAQAEWGICDSTAEGSAVDDATTRWLSQE